MVGGGGSALIDTWMHLMDIGTCHVAHRVTPPLNLTPADIEAVQEYNSWEFSEFIRNNSHREGRVHTNFQRISYWHDSCTDSLYACVSREICNIYTRELGGYM